jgi:hypothetical protein
MKSFSTSVTIHARPETIWTLLTDAAAYPRWNSTIERIDGHIAPGERIRVFAKATPGRAFPLKVSESLPPSKMMWSGGMPLGLFTGTRTFTIVPASDGQTRFEMREAFGGLLAPLITKSIPDLQPSFDTFAADLKRQAEQVG